RLPRRQGRVARLLRRPGDEGDGREGRPARRQRAPAREAERINRALATAGVLVTLLIAAPAATADGSFQSSDDLLNQIWQDSENTAQATTSKPVNLDPHGCTINLPLVLLDSPIRDRCPWIGDTAVDGLSLLLTHEPLDVLRDTIAWYATNQNGDGSIPASP